MDSWAPKNTNFTVRIWQLRVYKNKKPTSQKIMQRRTSLGSWLAIYAFIIMKWHIMNIYCFKTQPTPGLHLVLTICTCRQHLLHLPSSPTHRCRVPPTLLRKGVSPLSSLNSDLYCWDETWCNHNQQHHTVRHAASLPILILHFASQSFWARIRLACVYYGVRFLEAQAARVLGEGGPQFYIGSRCLLWK